MHFHYMVPTRVIVNKQKDQLPPRFNWGSRTEIRLDSWEWVEQECLPFRIWVGNLRGWTSDRGYASESFWDVKKHLSNHFKTEQKEKRVTPDNLQAS